ncbi:MAG: enterobactin transporter EntS [Pseudonocardiaceae bacterium]
MRLGQFVIDVAPLRASSGFRLVFAAQAISMLGAGLTSVAVYLQVYQLTGSSLQVGLIGLVFGLSVFVGLLAGGVLADRIDRKKTIVGTRATAALVIAGLAVNATVPDPQLWLVYLAAVLAGGISGLGGPALLAITPALVGPRHLAAAGALITVTTQFGAMLGPVLAGLITAGPGLAACFAVDTATFVVSTTLLALVPSQPPGGADATAQHPLRSMAEGLRFLRRNQVVAGLLLIDVCAMVFAMPYALFPELGTERFGGGPSVVGLLFTAPAVGAFLGALASGWAGRIRRTGSALIGAVLWWGAAITCFGLSGHLWLALGCLVLAGAGDTTSEILRRALLQHHTPDRLQGRVGSLWLAQAHAGPAVGNAEAGLMARLVSAPAAIVLGGLICIAGVAAVALALPAFRRASLHGPGADDVEPADLSYPAR